MPHHWETITITLYEYMTKKTSLIGVRKADNDHDNDPKALTLITAKSVK